MTRAATQRLIEAGVTTLAALGELAHRASEIPDLNPRILERLRRQARSSSTTGETGRLRYELIPPNPDEPGKGLAALPAPSPLDMFFDIEADPWAIDDGLEYLFGVDRGRRSASPSTTPIWAHDRAEEKALFERFVDIVMDAPRTRSRRCTSTTTAATSRARSSG